jgi:LysM repeat protein
MPQVNLPLPLALGLLVAFIALGAGATFAGVELIGPNASEPSPSPTVSPTATTTAAPTATETPALTWTPLPPVEHRIVAGETCGGLAAFYEVSIRSIQDLNPSMQCELLTIGTVLLIPQPTPTATPQPTATLSPAEATEAACEKVTYTVQANDTLGGIADNYNVDIQAIMDYNGMSGPSIFAGQVLIVPLCARNPTPGPSPTPTAPPPYPAPNLLLPLDGAAFTLSNDTVSLQWASVAQLRENEFYQVTVLDVTEGSGTQRLVTAVSNTSYVVPTSMCPREPLPHILAWWVTTVRQTGTNAAGEPIYTSAGATSVRRYFTWSGAAVGATPAP